MPGGPFNVSISGDKELVAAFNKLNFKVQRQLINRAGLPILQGVRQTAERNIVSVFARMRRSGKAVGFHMAEGLAIRRKMKRGIASISLAVNYKASPTNRLAHLIEWGFYNRWAKRRLPGHKFMTRAWETHEPSAVPLFAQELKRMVYEALAGKGPKNAP